VDRLEPGQACLPQRPPKAGDTSAWARPAAKGGLGNGLTWRATVLSAPGRSGKPAGLGGTIAPGRRVWKMRRRGGRSWAPAVRFWGVAALPRLCRRLGGFRPRRNIDWREIPSQRTSFSRPRTLGAGAVLLNTQVDTRLTATWWSKAMALRGAVVAYRPGRPGRAGAVGATPGCWCPLTTARTNGRAVAAAEQLNRYDWRPLVEQHCSGGVRGRIEAWLSEEPCRFWAPDLLLRALRYRPPASAPQAPSVWRAPPLLASQRASAC